MASIGYSHLMTAARGGVQDVHISARVHGPHVHDHPSTLIQLFALACLPSCVRAYEMVNVRG